MSTKTNVDNEPFSHIATESIGGGESGDIAQNTIQQYNMADNSIGAD
jgi:hypothetical protein